MKTHQFTTQEPKMEKIITTYICAIYARDCEMPMANIWEWTVSSFMKLRRWKNNPPTCLNSSATQSLKSKHLSLQILRHTVKPPMNNQIYNEQLDQPMNTNEQLVQPMNNSTNKWTTRSTNEQLDQPTLNNTKYQWKTWPTNERTQLTNRVKTLYMYINKGNKV